MSRIVLLSLILSLVTLQAHAWTDMRIVNPATDDTCIKGTPYNECISSKRVFVRTDTGTESGTVAVRLWERRDTPLEEFDPLMRKFGMTPGDYGRWYVRPGDDDYYGKSMILQGLKADDGKTVLLPAQFTRVLPLSDRMAVVRAVNKTWHLATMGSTTTTLTPLSLPWDSLQWLSGNEPKRPFMVLLRQNGKAKDDLRTYTILDGDGKAAYTVSGVIPNTHGTDDYFTFIYGYIGFPVRVENSEFSVIFNMITLNLEKMAPPFDILDVGYALTEKWDDNKHTSKYYPFQKIGEMPSGMGLLSTTIYEPVDEYKAEPQPLTDPKSTRGMVPLYLPGQIGGIRGWLMVYSNAQDQWYKLITHAPKTDEFHADKLGRWDELTPSSIRVYLWEPNEFLPLADIWIGTLPDETYKALFAGANPKDVPNPTYRIAARFFEDPAQKSKGGITDWYLIGSDPSAENLKRIYNTRAIRTSHPDNPQALATPELIAELKDEWKAKVSYREYLETPWEVQVARAQAEQERSLLSYADGALASGFSLDFNGDFYYVARTKGGKYLQAYWRQYRQLPRSADAYDICRRFGTSSMECGLVYDWANNISKGQREAAAEEAARYSQDHFNKDWNPAYRPPTPEPRCYQTGAKTETCFYN